MQSIFLTPEGKQELKELNKAKIIQLKKNLGRKVKLIKFELYRGGGFVDYSIVHPSLNKIKEFSYKSSENVITLKDENGNKNKLGLGSLQDFLEISAHGFSIIYDDLNRTRIYKGRGMKLTYEFLD